MLAIFFFDFLLSQKETLQLLFLKFMIFLTPLLLNIPTFFKNLVVYSFIVNLTERKFKCTHLALNSNVTAVLKCYLPPKTWIPFAVEINLPIISAVLVAVIFIIALFLNTGVFRSEYVDTFSVERESLL